MQSAGVCRARYLHLGVLIRMFTLHMYPRSSYFSCVQGRALSCLLGSLFCLLAGGMHTRFQWYFRFITFSQPLCSFSLLLHSHLVSSYLCSYLRLSVLTSSSVPGSLSPLFCPHCYQFSVWNLPFDDFTADHGWLLTPLIPSCSYGPFHFMFLIAVMTLFLFFVLKYLDWINKSLQMESK